MKNFTIVNIVIGAGSLLTGGIEHMFISVILALLCYACLFKKRMMKDFSSYLTIITVASGIIFLSYQFQHGLISQLHSQSGLNVVESIERPSIKGLSKWIFE